MTNARKARASRKAAAETPTEDTPEESPEALAAAQAELDAQLLADLQARDAEPEARETLSDAYRSVAEMIAKTKRDFRLGEPTLIKLWELTLMWELNMQQRAEREAAMRQQQSSFPFQNLEGGAGDEVVEDTPEPHETITAAPEE